MRLLNIHAGIGAFLVVLAGCQATSADDVCRAHPYGDMPQDVVAAFEIDARRADAIAGKDISSPLAVDPDARAVLCYADAAFPKAPPGADRSFDRGVYVVIGDDVRLVKLGYRESLEIVEP